MSRILLTLAVLLIAPFQQALAANPNLNDFRWGWLDGMSEYQRVPDEQMLSRTYIVVVDGSRSMEWDGRLQCPKLRERRIDVVKQAIHKSFEKLPPDVRMGMITFKGGVSSVDVEIDYNTSDEMNRAMESLVPDGGTPLKSAIELAFDRLRVDGAKKRGNGEYHLIVISDGDHSSPDEDPTEVLYLIHTSSPIQIHSIGFCLQSGHPLNQPFINYHNTTNESSMVDGLSATLRQVIIRTSTYNE